MGKHMKKYTRNILLLFLSLCPIHSAIADKLYNIELMVFEQADKRALGNELWPENPGTPNLMTAYQPTFIAPKQLKRPGNVKVLLHTAWQQPISKKSASSYIRITNQNDLDGTININSSRFLHADVDLLLTKNMKIMRQKVGMLGVSSNPSISGEERPVNFRLKQSQKIKSNETRYFDHPGFGVILLVNPAELN